MTPGDGTAQTHEGGQPDVGRGSSPAGNGQPDAGQGEPLADNGQPAASQPSNADTIDGVADSLPAGATPVEQGGFASRGRMRRRAGFLRKARELAYRDLGGLVFDLHRFGQRNDPLVLTKLNMLAQIDNELRRLESSLAERQPITVLREAGITACPRCAAIHGSENRFCPNCGLSLGRHPDLPIAVAGTPASGSQSPPAQATQAAPPAAAVAAPEPAPTAATAARRATPGAHSAPLQPAPATQAFQQAPATQTFQQAPVTQAFQQVATSAPLRPPGEGTSAAEPLQEAQTAVRRAAHAGPAPVAAKPADPPEKQPTRGRAPSPPAPSASEGAQDAGGDEGITEIIHPPAPGS